MTGKYYKPILAAVAVVLFFSNLSIYLNKSELVSLPSFYYVLGLAVAAVPLYFMRESLGLLRQSGVVRWGAGFATLSGLWLICQQVPSENAWNEFWVRVVSVFFASILLAVFSSPRALRTARWAILAALVLGVAFNVYEVFYPMTFSSTLGRSAGLYVNPNQAGSALILGMIFTVGLLPQRYRLLLALTTGFGVALTFSRGAMVCWLVTVLVVIKTGEISLRKSLVVGCAIFALFAAVTLLQWEKLQYKLEDIGALNNNVLNRIQWFDNFDGSDYSTSERRQAAVLAWDMFVDNPIWGHGVAASLEWDFQVSSHNQYLNMMVDHGILGCLFLPLFVLAAIRRARDEARRIGLTFAVFILSLGFFSHNIFSERYILLCFSLMSAMAVTSQVKTQTAAADHKLRRAHGDLQGAKPPLFLPETL